MTRPGFLHGQHYQPRVITRQIQAKCNSPSPSCRRGLLRRCSCRSSHWGATQCRSHCCCATARRQAQELRQRERARTRLVEQERRMPFLGLHHHGCGRRAAAAAERCGCCCSVDACCRCRTATALHCTPATQEAAYCPLHLDAVVRLLASELLGCCERSMKQMQPGFCLKMLLDGFNATNSQFVCIDIYELNELHPLL